jgi:hypothetical protein
MEADCRIEGPERRTDQICQLTSTHLTFPCGDGEAMLTSLRGRVVEADRRSKSTVGFSKCYCDI